jgi:hypothetical protein
MLIRKKQVVLPFIGTDNRVVLSACFSASIACSYKAYGFYSRRITLEDKAIIKKLNYIYIKKKYYLKLVILFSYLSLPSFNYTNLTL